MAKPTPQKIMELVDSMSDADKAKLAAELLNDTRCDRDTLETFFAALDDDAHTEIVLRAEDEEGRDDEGDDEDFDD